MIARYFRPLATHPGALGLVDDAALLTAAAGHDLVLTADALVGGVHFFPDDPPDMVAKKALRVNLSDLAAKGATPRRLPARARAAERRRRGVAAALCAWAWRRRRRLWCPLLGGDTVRTPGPMMVSITAFGTVPQGSMVTRSGAQRRRPHHGHRDDRRCRARSCAAQSRRRQRAGSCDAKQAGTHLIAALSPAAAAQRSGRGGARCTLRRRWTCPTAWSAISPSSAARPVSTAEIDDRRAFRCRRRRGACSLPIRRRSKPS